MLGSAPPVASALATWLLQPPMRPSSFERRSSAPVAALALVAALWSMSGPRSGTLPAQAPPDPAAIPVAEEAPFLEQGAKDLNAYATLCHKNGFPRRARDIWLEIVAEYHSDDEVARKALGFVRQGTVWQKDPNFEQPGQDNPNAAVASMLTQRWEVLAKKLGDGHRALAQQLEAKSESRARYHYRRALRFLPGDQKAIAGTGSSQFEGLTGDAVDIALLQRSRKMERAITKLLAQKFPVKPVASGTTHRAFDKAGRSYPGFETEHFTVWGDWEPEVLQEAAVFAERALAFCQDAYQGFDGFPPKGGRPRHLAFFKQKDTWAHIVRAHADSIGKQDVEFTIQNASATTLPLGPDALHLAGVDDSAVVYDQAVRWVAWDYSGLRSDGMREGIGHAIVGMFFGRNLVFTVGQEQQKGTVSGKREAQKLLLPDLETWGELAVELAWSKTGTSAAKLPLVKAAQFPSDARIKAWSFCDYLLRRDPALLQTLDRCGAKARHEGDVLEEFRGKAPVPLEALEEGWRRFWTEDTPLRRAIKNKVTPLEATSKEAPAWLSRFNELRAMYQAPEVGWSAQLSTDCRMHVDYLKKNKDQRGADKEHTQVAGKDGFTNAGRTFAERAIVWTRDKDPKKATELWMALPGYRNAILNRNIDTVGIYADSGIVVLDVTRGRAASNQATMALFPFANVTGGRFKDPVPSAVDVDLLGPEVQNLLRREKRDKQKQVGFPLSIHFYGGNSGEVQCHVTANGQPVPGWLVAANGPIGRTSAGGMWVFYPAEPLKKGVDIKAVWSYAGGTQEVTFAVQ